MLFNSYEFIFLFLPAAMLIYYLIGVISPKWAAVSLLCSSVVFYGIWDSTYVPLLCGSTLFNYFVGRGISVCQQPVWRRRALIGGVASNLLLLGYYKYTSFILSNLPFLAGTDIPKIDLPLGISFFTFTQIAFLVDTYRKEASEPNISHYGLFVTFFPHLLAGPIIHHKEMMPQFRDRRTYRFNEVAVCTGILFFLIGLIKKVGLADNFAPFVAPVFNSANWVFPPSLIEAWVGALSYTFQLYFDFSGYSDMAIGLALLFGIRLPINFNSPYKAKNIIEFWKRWHITLSRFLKEYLYIPLGGNRGGEPRRYLNLFLTMLLGGLWHGAGWGFVAWGALHGSYLALNHGLRKLVRLPEQSTSFAVVSVLTTFGAVVIGWVLFRSDSLEVAIEIIKGMFGLNGVVISDSLRTKLGPVGTFLIQHGVAVRDIGYIGSFSTLLYLFSLGFLLIWGMPNSQQLVNVMASHRFLQSTGNRAGGFLAGIGASIVFFAVIIYLQRGSEFLYYRF